MIEREAPGIAEAIRRASDGDGRGFGMLSRGVAGTRGAGADLQPARLVERRASRASTSCSRSPPTPSTSSPAATPTDRASVADTTSARSRRRRRPRSCRPRAAAECERDRRRCGSTGRTCRRRTSGRSGTDGANVPEVALRARARVEGRRSAPRRTGRGASRAGARTRGGRSCRARAAPSALPARRQNASAGRRAESRDHARSPPPSASQRLSLMRPGRGAACRGVRRAAGHRRFAAPGQAGDHDVHRGSPAPRAATLPGGVQGPRRRADGPGDRACALRRHTAPKPGSAASSCPTARSSARVRPDASERRARRGRRAQAAGERARARNAYITLEPCNHPREHPAVHRRAHRRRCRARRGRGRRPRPGVAGARLSAARRAPASRS